MKNTNKIVSTALTQAPSLALPDAEAARRVVARWLRTEIGDALYPAEATFLEESFAWHVSVWLSTAQQPMVAWIADVYVHAATGAFLGRPTREEIVRRLDQITDSEG
jgi:hypothetical protein